MALTGCDPHALQVARELHQSEQPELTILFGSRARGDYRDGVSDIDIMVVQPETPPWEHQTSTEQAATDAAELLCGYPAPVHIIWKTSAEFHRMRRSINDVVANALRDGVIMPPELEANYRNQDDDDYSYEWSVTDERIRHAEMHITAFNLMVESGMHDDLLGQHAHSALEHALKALISARGRGYQHIHNIHLLTRDALAADPDFQFAQGIDGGIYNQYAGRDEYKRTENPISHIPGYREIVNADVRAILNRVQEIRELAG